MTTGPMQTPPAAPTKGIAERRAAMAVLVEASAQELATLLEDVEALPAHDLVRPPEIGLVMVQGRIGGDGRAFNVGEATVSRAAVRLTTGEIGFSCVLGRDRDKARLVALCDALLQSGQHAAEIAAHVVAPVRRRIEGERELVAARTAATRVDFFTLVRGEG
jgi:alpha-D-ribose 1-methylphosphonate 5-triphosphate synthase subunit PhnG